MYNKVNNTKVRNIRSKKQREVVSKNNSKSSGNGALVASINSIFDSQKLPKISQQKTSSKHKAKHLKQTKPRFRKPPRLENLSLDNLLNINKVDNRDLIPENCNFTRKGSA